MANPYQRIIENAKKGIGVHLSAEEVQILASDHAIYEMALDEEEKVPPFSPKSESMRDKPCEKCGKGAYTETSFWDDMDGVLHCDKCRHRVKSRQ